MRGRKGCSAVNGALKAIIATWPAANLWDPRLLVRVQRAGLTPTLRAENYEGYSDSRMVPRHRVF